MISISKNVIKKLCSELTGLGTEGGIPAAYARLI